MVTASRAIRASDRDRDQAVAVLQEEYVRGRLGLDEFRERMSAAYESTTWGDLLDLTADLPAGLRPGTDLAAPRPSRPRRRGSRAWLPSAAAAAAAALALIAALVSVSLMVAGLASVGHHHRPLFLGAWPVLVILLILARRRAG